MAQRRFQRYRTGRRWLTGLALVGIVVFHGVVIARLFLSPEQFRARTELLLRQYFPGRVSVGSARYSLASGFRLGRISLGRPEERGGGEMFQARAITVDCRLWPLLRGRVVVDDLVFEQPSLSLTKKDLEGMKGGPTEAPKAPVARVIVRNGHIQLGSDLLVALRLAGGSAQELRAVNLELRKESRLENAFRFEGSADSDLWGRCDLQGTIDLKRRRLDVAIVARGIAVGPRLREILPASYTEVLDLYGVQGVVDLKSEVTLPWGEGAEPELKATVELHNCTATYRRFPLRCTDINGRIEVSRGNFYYRDLVGRAGPATLELSGQTTKEKIEVHLRGRGRPLDRELYDAATPELRRVWDRFDKLAGSIDVDYTSTWTRESKRFDPIAQVQVRGGSGVYKAFPYPLEDLTGSVRWESFVTTFQNLVGRHGNARIELAGRVTDRGVPDLKILAFDLPLDETLYQALTKGWQETFRQLDPQGTTAVECRVTSPTDDPSKLEYRIRLFPEGASFKHQDFAHRITDVRGEIHVDETGTVTLKGVRGKLASFPLEFHGTVTASPKGPVLDLTVVASDVELGTAARAILNDAWKTAYDQLDPQGRVAVTWKLATDAATGKTRHTTEIRAGRDCSVQHRQFPVRVTNLLGQMAVDGTGRTEFRGIKGRIGDATVEALDGQYLPGPEGGLRFTLKARGLALNDTLRRAIPDSWQAVWDEVQPSGEADAEYQYATNPKEPDRPLQHVSLEPTDAAFCYQKLPLSVTDVARGKITFDPDGNATISNIEGKHQGKLVQLTGKAMAGADGAVLRLDVTAAELTVDAQLQRLFPKEWQEVFELTRPTGKISATVNAVVQVRKAEWQQFRLRATLDGCEAVYAKFPIRLTDLRGRVEYADGVISLIDVAGRSPVADQVLLEGRVSRAEATPTRLRVRAQNLRCDAETRAALPPDVRAALDKLAFKGAADVDLTLTRAGKLDSPTESFGTITLRDCSFHRSYDFDQVSGEVRIDKGVARADGSQEFAGGVHLRKLVFRRLAATGIDGSFSYTRLPSKGGKDAALGLSVTDLVGSFYGGRATAEARLDLTDGTPAKAVVRLNNVDLKELCTEALHAKRQVSGLLDLRLDFPPGHWKDAKGLVGDGWARVDNGDLGSLPLAMGVFSVLRFELPEQRSLTEAEMKFAIAADHLEVKEISLGRKGWMMTGSGKIGFDESLDLRFITPRRGTPLDLIGITLDNVVQVELGGTVSDPKPRPQPLPLIPRAFEQFKSLFGDWQRRTPRKNP